MSSDNETEHIFNHSKRNQAWNDIIQPIIEKYGLHFHYDFLPPPPKRMTEVPPQDMTEVPIAPEGMTEVDVSKMQQFVVQFCNTMPFDNFFQILKCLLNGTEHVDNYSLRTLFVAFFDKIIHEKTLPHFLEVLARDRTHNPEAWPPITETIENWLDVVKDARILHVNDIEVEVQLPKRTAIPFSSQAMGFRNERTTEWKTFLLILQKGKHETTRASQRKMLDRLNLKLIKFFNKQFSLGISEKAKLFEPDYGEKDTYQPVFKTKKHDDKIPKEILIKQLEEMIDKPTQHDLARTLIKQAHEIKTFTPEEASKWASKF